VGVWARSSAELRREATFTQAGWDFVGETANGTSDLWWIQDGQDYPRLAWEQMPADTPEERPGEDPASLE
jgi:hypothetical protein